jgi:hypothetical protein
MQITTIGLDLAKSVFQVHGIDATGADILWPVNVRRSAKGGISHFVGVH